jgi:activator of 2-hydroxyglutaryl-CoA dehydratase/predicted nucleotide-binding protein (sugar kinase/HSP70/actin superfamily)
VFRDWYRRADVASCAALGATGLHADELVEPVIAGLPEDACLRAGLEMLEALDGPLNVVSIGARGYSVTTRNADGHYAHQENDKCSSGTGETMVKIAGRFGLSIEQADALALDSEAAIPITARCSVFAKSEMTHFGNQGRPAAALFRGYFGSVANFVAALLERIRVDGPVMLVGGGARIGALVRGLSEAVGGDVAVLPEGSLLEAMGAVSLAAEQYAGDTLAALPEDPDALIESSQRRFRVLEPPRAYASRTRRMQAPPIPAGAEHQPAVLGIDLGSTGSKAVLTSIATGEIVAHAYDRTRGNPVEAAQRLIDRMTTELDVDVRAIGLTGSGREAAATIMRAAFPDMVDRIGVINEIVAHATAAIRCDNDGGRSLSVVEIGGQDAKFIQIVDGQIVESDMNKACSAGTGSFLEEQAVFYGVHDIGEFTTRACDAERPPDLGQMCTVFVAEAAADAHNEGFSLEDLFGGFQYSVIHNYINRVMGQRTFGDRIFFQGKPATGPALGWTLAGVTDREVVIPPNPGAMGAWGVGIHMRHELGELALRGADAFDLRQVLGAEVVGHKEIQCRDKKCATLCNISKTTIAVRDTKRTVVSGGACPKYEISTASRPKLAVEAPSAFDARGKLLEPYLQPDDAAGRVVNLPITGATFGIVPWLVTLLRELGLSVHPTVSKADSLHTGEGQCYSYDACAPIKIAHALADPSIDTVFMPKLITLPDRDGDGGTTCSMEQALPEMVAASLEARGYRGRVVAPPLHLGKGLNSLEVGWALAKVLPELGASRRKLPRAMRAAAKAQAQYEANLAMVGHHTLTYGRRWNIPVVVVCGALHAIHDPSVNAGIPKLLRENGVLALPMDCFPIPPTTPDLPRAGWGDATRALRAAVAARSRGDVYPLMLSSFGCGPGSFTEQVFAGLMEGYPYTSLESDGHGGSAGYVTRVQAFLHTVRQHSGQASRVSDKRLRMLEPLPKTPIESEKDARLVIFTIADRISPIMAAAFRSYGFDAVPSGPASGDLLALGRRDCSGKECVPYQLIWGGFRDRIENDDGDKRMVLMQVSGEGRCRNCMFSIKDQLSLERMGVDDHVSLRHYRSESSFKLPFSMKTWMGATAWDLLLQLSAYYRPTERDAGAVDRFYERYCDELEAIIAQPADNGGDPARTKRACLALLRRASVEIKGLAAATDESRLRTVVLSGDVYVRVDEFASDSLIHRLNSRGVRVIVEPTSVISEYMAEERLSELMGLPTTFFANQLSKRLMKRIRREFQAAVRHHHEWLPTPDVLEIMKAGEGILDRYPQSEAPVTIGSVMHHWNEGMCDGVVLASPWGCGPSLVSEALLRHQRDIPMLFIYSDGSPIDQRRLNAFAFRLRRNAPQRRVS